MSNTELQPLPLTPTTVPEVLSTPELESKLIETIDAEEQSPTPTPTAVPRVFPTLDTQLPTPATSVPTPAVPLGNEDELLNILLLGNDVPWAQGGRTDSMILISLNRQTGDASILSIPRDLYVVIPGWRMNRINLALPHGHGSDYPGGGGALVKETILYNLGIPVDHYVRIGFSGFKEIVDGLGGVEVVVNCPVEDWRLRTPDLDPEIEENWEPFLLKTGVHNMDGDLALWYVRSRHNSNDIDRGRRQQKMIRAIWQRGRSTAALTDLPRVWHAFAQMYETDMQLSDVVELAAWAVKVNEVDHLILGGEAIRPWKIPGTGEAVQLLDPGGAEPILQQFMGESVLNKAEGTAVEVVVETNDPIMYRQVADNLLWYGFAPSLLFREEQDPVQTTVSLSSSSLKGSYAARLAPIFRIDTDEIVLGQNGKQGTAVYHVDLGRYHNPCLPYLELSSLK